MRILCLTPSFQHPRVRGPHRYYHFLRHLSQRHAITLLTLVRSEVPDEAQREIGSFTERLLTFDAGGAGGSGVGQRLLRLPTIGGPLARRRGQREGVERMKHTFRQLVRDEVFDVVLFHGKSLFPVIEDWGGLPLVLDFCDATSLRYRTELCYARISRAPLLAMRYLRIRRVERGMIRKTRHLAFVSHRDREAVLGPGSGARIIPIGVDSQYWRRSTSHPVADRIVFHGVMDYAPNGDGARRLVERILPLVRRSVVGAQVHLIGRNPTPSLVKHAAQNPAVTVTGTVDDVRPHLEAGAVYAAPIRFASGVQNKILEAMALGIPVVTTGIVAAGLRTGGGDPPPLVVADHEADVAESIIRLLRDDAERARLATAGRRFVEEHFSWPRIAEELEGMCLAAAATVSRT